MKTLSNDVFPLTINESKPHGPRYDKEMYRKRHLRIRPPFVEPFSESYVSVSRKCLMIPFRNTPVYHVQKTLQQTNLHIKALLSRFLRVNRVRCGCLEANESEMGTGRMLQQCKVQKRSLRVAVICWVSICLFSSASVQIRSGGGLCHYFNGPFTECWLMECATTYFTDRKYHCTTTRA